MKTLAIFGAGGLGVEILEMARIVNERDNRWDGYIFVNNGDAVDPVCGVEVMGIDTALSKYPDSLEAVIAVGEPTLRAKIAREIEDNHLPKATIIYPSVYIPASAVIGDGVCIFPGAYVSTNVVIKDNVLVSPNAVIGHDNVIDNNVILSSTSVLCGMVHVKESGYIGPGAIVKENLTVGHFSVAAMGSVVFKDIEDGALAIGNPARASKRSGEKIFNG